MRKQPQNIQTSGLSKLFVEFFESERSSAVLLIACTIVSILLANSQLAVSYVELWQYELGGHALNHWINDGLMAIFFLLIGLELEREVYKGELSNFRVALLPAIAALGGMVVPALIYYGFNQQTPFAHGFGIPMATDIAFALGILSLHGKRVPAALKIFLTAIAVIDDLGAIIVIAVFYSSHVLLIKLALAATVFAVLFILNRLKVHNPIPYIIGGIALWYFMYQSGIHATLAGVLLAFVIPFGDGGERTLSYRLQHFLHKPVAFFILPVFALSNTALALSVQDLKLLAGNAGLGIILGLIMGKPIGIFLFSLIAVKTKLCKLPQVLNWQHVAAAGILGGVGFTMAIFISMLAFNNEEQAVVAKLSVLAASVLAALFGYLYLHFILKKQAA